jgi:hypothetical protein
MNVLVGLTAPLAFYSRRQLEGALDRCRALAERIENELRDKGPEHFVDEFSLADFCASLERAADVLKRTVSPEHTCSHGEGSAGAGPSAPPIIEGDLRPEINSTLLWAMPS